VEDKIIKNIRGILAALIAASFTISAQAQAQQDWRSWPSGDRFRVGVGYFSPKLDTAVVVTDDAGTTGTGISFERNLGLDDNKATALIEAQWRFFKRHKISLNYFDLQRSASKNASVTIGVGGEFFDIDLPIQSFFDITAYEISYSYSILFDEKKELHVGAGISLQNLELGIQGTESSPNPGETIISTLNSTAPLPTFNVGFDYAFGDNWIFESSLGWLAVELEFDSSEKLGGSIINAKTGIRWKAFEHTAFYARYQVFDVDVSHDTEVAKFSVNYDYNGPVIGVSVNF
jgi:hypothetical protein